MKRQLLAAAPNRHITHVILEMLSEAGWTWNSLKPRQLSFETHDSCLHVFMIKTHDIPRMVANKVFDFGFVQASVVTEEACPVKIMGNFPIAQGKMAVGVKNESIFKSPEELHGKRIVTRNPRLADLFLKQNQIECSVTVVSGSPEAYICAGAGDAVLAYWKTGQTFLDNDLRILADVCKSNLQLIALENNPLCREISSTVSRIEGCLRKRVIPERWCVA